MSRTPDPQKNDIPEGFTLGMALMDLMPVVFFGIGVAAVGRRLNSGLFWTGAVLCIAAGLGKVSWKLCLALMKKNIPLLNRQLRVLMPAGFVLLLAGVLTSPQRLPAAKIWAGVLQMPAALFFAGGIAGMIAMMVMGRTRSSLDAKANWHEQLVNALTQLALLLGVLFWR